MYFHNFKNFGKLLEWPDFNMFMNFLLERWPFQYLSNTFKVIGNASIFCGGYNSVEMNILFE